MINMVSRTHGTKDRVRTILEEIRGVVEQIRDEEVDALIDVIFRSNIVVVCGAGRVGYAMRGFGMRLGHFGIRSYAVGDTTVPAIARGDLFLVASGSGETQTMYDLATIAKRNMAHVALVTGNPLSRIGRIADSIVELRAPSKTKDVANMLQSIQPMTTLNEQCLSILFDAVVLRIMERTGETHETMWSRHSNLE